MATRKLSCEIVLLSNLCVKQMRLDRSVVKREKKSENGQNNSCLCTARARTHEPLLRFHSSPPFLAFIVLALTFWSNTLHTFWAEESHHTFPPISLLYLGTPKDFENFPHMHQLAIHNTA